MTITISFTSATKISALVQDGGNWNDGYLCPKLYIGDKNQGEARIYAKEITEPTGEQKYGMTFAFTSAPKNDLIKKVGTDLGSNKFRVAFRKMLNKSKYVNPWGNKYIEGTFQDETGHQYAFKLLLPYKTFGWVINDEQGNKIAKAMNEAATLRTASVVSAKYTLRKNFLNYADTKRALEAITKNKASYEQYVKEKEAKLNSMKGEIDGLRAKATEAQKNLNTKKVELLDAEKTLNDLLKKETAIASEMTAINESVETLSKGESDMAKTKSNLTTIVNDTKKIIDAEYVKLLKNAPQRTTDINQSKTDLYGSNKDGFKTNLAKIYP
jgi:predicted  nucleic acid-binding Zn-ribbon protein